IGESLPGPQLIFMRGLFATVLLLAVVGAMGALRHVPRLGDRRLLLRAGFDSVATMAYLTSLFHLPIGEATAINMATPLFITLFAVLAFREHVGAGRWVAIATGFTGVLLVVQPSAAAFNAYALLCVFGTLLHSARDLATRYIDEAIPSIVITFSSAIAVTLLSGAWTLLQGWHPVQWRQLGLLAAASVFLSLGYYLLIISMRDGEMSLIAPFRYTGLLFALLLGFLVWGDVPNALAWGGIALLVAAGLYVLHGERSRGRPELEPAAD
ncbi:MAG: DMT family transporter, partial [Comamonadaceae bacterium]